MDKIQFIPQPHASILCVGMLKMVHSDAQLEKFDRIYIYADEQVFNLERSIEQKQMLRNMQLFGAVSNPLPTKAIVGYVVIGGQILFEENSLLKQGFLYEVYEACVFDNPMLVSQEQALSLVETNYLEGIPSHTILHPIINGDNGILSFPVSVDTFFSLNDGSEIQLEVTPDMMNVIFNENGRLKDFSEFHLFHGNQVKPFKWNERCFVDYDTDDQCDIIFYKSEQQSGMAPRQVLRLLCFYK